MHISDGVLHAPVWLSGYAVSAAIITVTTKKMHPEEIPKTAIMTSVFFVSSLIHVPIGPTSVHLILNGLIGMVLGPLAFVSIFLGLLLQAILFQHGGITTIGINSVIVGLPALLAYRVFDLRNKSRFRLNAFVFGALAGACGVFFTTLMLVMLLIITGSEFFGVAKVAFLAHLPVIAIESIITGFIASFIMKVKPEIFERRK